MSLKPATSSVPDVVKAMMPEAQSSSQKPLQGTTPSQWPKDVTLREVKERMAQWPGKGVTALQCHCLTR